MKEVLRRLLAGELTEAEAVAELRRVQLQELEGRARLDLGRDGRRGVPEVVLAAGKSPEAAARLAVSLAREQGQGLVSRLGGDHWAALPASDATRWVSRARSVPWVSARRSRRAVSVSSCPWV